jgi:hypothetical protein
MLSQFTHSFIEIEVSDRAPGIKQKARWRSMTPSQDDAGQVSILVTVEVRLYEDVAGAYGPELTGNGLHPYQVTLVANNDTAVDPTTGEVLIVRQLQTPAEWLAQLEADPRQLMLQGDFFEVLIAYSPIAIGELLENFMRQADAPPFTKFQPHAPNLA